MQGMIKLDTLVVQDIFMTETLRMQILFYLHLHMQKKWNFPKYQQTGRYRWEERQLMHPEMLREDLQIIIDLANALGLNWNYSHASDVFKEMSEIMPFIK